MPRVILFFATIAALSFAGCAGSQNAGPALMKAGDGDRMGDARPLVDAVPMDRARPFTDVTCPADALGTTRCRISTSITTVAGMCKIDAPNILFDKPNRRYILVWSTPSNDYRFCPLLGDGVTFKKQAASDDEQFDDGWAGDNAGDFGDGANYLGKACFKRFRIWAANSKSKGQYDYNVQFRNMKTGEVCTVDPFIRNG